MVLARPENLYFLLLLIPLGLGWLFYRRWRLSVIRRAGDQTLIQAMIASADQRGANIARAFQLAGITLLIIALAQPQWGMSDEEMDQDSLDIVFALDLSSSMLAEDIAPNRLMAAHQELNQVMQRLKGDRVGLVIFTSLSFIQSPLTTDYGAIDFFLRRLHPDQIPVGGTSIGAAMSDSLDALTGRKRQQGDQTFHRAENQVIVLLTDGEDHESSPIAAAEQARDVGIRVVTVGIGSRDGAPIPQFDQRGNRTGYLRNKQGESVITRLDEDTLREMAQITGGTYIHFERPGQVATQLIAFIDELERSAMETQISRRYIDRFHYFLIPGFLLLTISLLLGHRRSWRPFRIGKFWPLALALFLSTTGCQEVLQKLDPTAQRAAQAIENEEFEEALKLLDSIADTFDQTPEYHFNRGRALLGLERFEEARQAFARALSSQNPALRADAHYHMGLSFGAEEAWRDARQSFQQGLDLFLKNEHLHEPELYQLLRENLEISFQRLYPPCSTFRDAEQARHNRPQDALLLAEFSLEDQVLCGPEPEYFALPVMTDGNLSVQARFHQLRDEVDPEHLFLPHQSGAQLIIYDSTGQSILSIDKGLEQSDEELNKANQTHRFERHITDFTVKPEHLGGQREGLILIALLADPGLEFAVDLELEFVPSCQALDDEFEPNNSAQEAASLAAGQHQLHLCPGDEDWFEITVDAGESLFVDLAPQPEMASKKKPELLFELRSQDGRSLLAETHEDGPFLTTGLQDIEAPTTFLLRVTGTDPEQQGPYSLEIHQRSACPPPPVSGERPRAYSIGPEQQQLRYQRLCPGHPEHYLIAPDEEGHVKWSLSTLPQGVWAPRAHQKQDFPEQNLELFRLQDSRLIATSSPPTPLPEGDDQPPASLTRDQILFAEDAPIGEQGLLRITGEPGFYHLQRQDEQDQDEQDQDEQEDQDDQNQDEQEQDDSEQDSQDQDQDEQSQEQDADEQTEPTDGDGDESQQDEEKPQPEQTPHEEEDEELSEESLQILRSLEELDGNFQLQRSFEDMHYRPVERDW